MLAPYIADRTIVGPMIGDDIKAEEWGPQAPYLDRYDVIAGAAEAHLPGINVLIRARPGELAQWTWKNKIVAWAQYSHRKGPVLAYATEDMALAKKLGMGLLFGLNVLNGGDGTSNIAGFPLGKWQMSAQEILAYGKVLLPKGHVFVSWRYSLNFDLKLAEGTPASVLAGIKAFDTRADVRAAFKELQSLGASLPRPPIQDGG